MEHIYDICMHMLLWRERDRKVYYKTTTNRALKRFQEDPPAMRLVETCLNVHVAAATVNVLQSGYVHGYGYPVRLLAPTWVGRSCAPSRWGTGRSPADGFDVFGPNLVNCWTQIPGPAQGWNNRTLISHERWYVVKCVSQKRNQSNNKNQW